VPAFPLTTARRDRILAALSRLAGEPVQVIAEEHVGHDWAPLTRLTLDRDIPGVGSSVIVKTRRVDGEGHGGPAFLRREAAALATADLCGVTARALHVDDGAGVMLQTDLGAWPTLQDLLLGDDPGAAARGMEDMGTAVGRLHAATLDRAPRHERNLAGFAADVTTGLAYRDPQGSWGVFEQACRDLDLPSPRPARDEVAGLVRRTSGQSSATALTHVDLNPTNVLVTDHGARLVDFEGSRFGHLGIDACFLHYPFPHHSSPWATLPEGVIASADAAYRAALAEGGADGVLAQYDQVLADGAAVVLIGRLSRLRLIARPDQAPQDSRRRRGQTVQQIRTFTGLAERAEGLSALRDRLRALAEAMVQRWPDAGHPPAPLFPAFTAEDASRRNLGGDPGR
jgi:Phosphotransferase enzyme family